MSKDPIHLRSVLEQLLKDFGTPEIKVVTSVVDQWQEIVGVDLAKKVSAVAVSGSELIVKVDDPAWDSQISWLAKQLLVKITRSKVLSFGLRQFCNFFDLAFIYRHL